MRYICTTVSVIILIACTTFPSPVRGQVVDSTSTDSLLVDELARELAGIGGGVLSATPAAARPPLSISNPEISVIGDFRAQYLSEGQRNVDLQMHEVETALRSAVDPYARADVFLAIHEEDGDFEFHLEEAYLTTLSLPLHLQLRAGKFRSSFGKINRVHPHALPYIGVPSMYLNYFGEDGLNDQGLSLSWLVPNPRFFQEVIFEITRGPGENASFAAQETNRLLYAGRIRNFWDLSRNSTLELGLGGVAGPNETGHTSLLGGLDFTYIWKPLQFNVYQSVTLQAESFFSRRESDVDVVKSWGGFATAQYRFARRWMTTLRLDASDLPDDPDWNERGASLTMGWLASEFQKVELGLRMWNATDLDTTLQAVVRAIFVIGSHGAHEY